MAIHIPFGSASRAADTYNSNSLALPREAGLAVYVDVTDEGTGGTLDVKVQESVDGGTNWFDRHTFSEISAASRVVARIGAPTSGLVRINAVVGTDAVEFEVRVITT